MLANPFDNRIVPYFFLSQVATSSGPVQTVAFTGLKPGTKYTANVTGFVNDDGNELESPVGSAAGTTCELLRISYCY